MSRSGVSAIVHRTLRLAEAGREGAGHAWTRIRDRGLTFPGSVWVTFRGNSVPASPWESSRAAVNATLATCVEALGSLPHRVNADGWELPTITVADWDAAMAALRRTDGPPLYTGDRHPLPLARAQPSEAARLFRCWEVGGRMVAGPDVGVNICLSDTTRAPRVGDIDLVFTWVNGSDPTWRAARDARLGRSPGLHPTAANDARFDQIDELRYALRAVERYAPWRRHVFLVTNGQRPSWLAEEFPHVVLVRHEELFDDPTALPTFNSHAIESRLHHIDGLAERWVYFNDDVFLGRYTPPSVFFDESGNPRVFLAEETIPDVSPSREDQPVVAAAKSNREVLARLTGQPLRHKLKHVAHPQLRSVGAELERRAPAEFRETGRSPFRAPENLSVASSLAPHYALATGRASLGSVSHFYADVGSPELAWRLPHLLEWRDADIACLNATESSPRASRAVVRGFLDAYLPTA